MLENYKTFFQQLVLANNKLKQDVDKTLPYNGIGLLFPERERIFKALDEKNYTEFWDNANDQNIEFIANLMAKMPGATVVSMIKHDNCYSLQRTLNTKNTETRKLLLAKIKENKIKDEIIDECTSNLDVQKDASGKSIVSMNQIIADNDYEAFRFMAGTGRLEYVQNFINIIAKDKLLEMIVAKDNDAIVQALNHGHIEIAKCLLAIYEKEFSDITYIYNLICTIAAKKGHLEIVKLVIQKIAPDILATTISTSDYNLITSCSDISIIKLLFERAKLSNLNTIIAKNDYVILLNTAKNGNVETAEYIKEVVGSEKFNQLIANTDYTVLDHAFYNGNIDIVKFFLEIVEINKLSDAVFNNIVKGCRIAVFEDNTEVIKLILSKFNDYNQKIVSSDDFFIFKQSINNTNLNMVKVIIGAYINTAMEGLVSKWAEVRQTSTLCTLPNNSQLMKLLVENSSPSLLCMSDMYLGYCILNKTNIAHINNAIDALFPLRLINKEFYINNIGLLKDVFYKSINYLFAALPFNILIAVYDTMLYNKENNIVFDADVKLPEPLKFRFNIYDRLCNDTAIC